MLTLKVICESKPVHTALHFHKSRQRIKMITYNVFARTIAMCICILAADGLDRFPKEDVNEERIDRLSIHLDNLKNLINEPADHYNNLQQKLFWQSSFNRESEKNRFLNQYYIEPILNSLNELVEQFKLNNNNNRSPNLHRWPEYGFLPQQLPSSFSSQGGVSGWGSSIPPNTDTYSGDSGGQLSFNSPSGGYSPFINRNLQSDGVEDSKRVYTPVSGQSHGYDINYNSGIAQNYNPTSISEDSQSNVANRYPDDYDQNQNWGLVVEKKDEEDNAQRISSQPTINKQSDCNCEEQIKKNTTLATMQRSSVVTAITCKAVVLTCCTPGITEIQRKDCFTSQGCLRSYETGLACLPVVIRAIFKELYQNL
ncbi:uncharacterized protein [Battus philenor]|uniref:uncharacterized protein n=1 Tax=Battus philenor TaxID=42288 RepID=UPI0035D01A63